MDLLIILQRSSSAHLLHKFQAAAKRGKQQHYEKRTQVRNFNIISTAVC